MPEVGFKCDRWLDLVFLARILSCGAAADARTRRRSLDAAARASADQARAARAIVSSGMKKCASGPIESA